MRPENKAERGKSPLATAILISFAIAAGTVLSTLDASIFEEITSGRWLTRSFGQAQEHNSAAIAKLEREVGTVTTDIDFVAARVGAAIQRNESTALDRFAEVEARIAALKERIAGVQATQAAARAPDADQGDLTLRSSLHELAAAHNGAVSAIRRRLDRIEVAVGISTDVMSSAMSARRNALKKPAPQNFATPERGHIFNIKPVSQQAAPLRLSRLRD
jgi:uncharacterized small protein (DUF1192 family)